ncbi:MAG TPA: hypothetical protein P5144_14660 [Thermoanaerobaculia bacterium]|nr:hypothetical protein [Thermoanaerobaculaceae bacterium]HRS37228.1 hypothetical protein [Thermoanaerobaculia bacterium]HRU10613.1 hypothetical protein [Thermoanaerobaculia bacterium]
MALKMRDRVKETTTTVGTGAYTLGGATTGFRAFSAVLTNGDTCYYVCTDGVSWETGLGTYTHQPLTGHQLARTTIYASSNSGSAVNWSAGTRDIFQSYPAEGLLFTANNLSELIGTRTLVLANLGLLPSSQSGGANGQVVRLSSADTWVAASRADTVDQLVGLMFRQGNAYWPPGSVITGLSGLTAGAVYYLSTSGAITTVAPTPSGSLRRVVIGKAISTTALLFWPGTPITG